MLDSYATIRRDAEEDDGSGYDNGAMVVKKRASAAMRPPKSVVTRFVKQVRVLKLGTMR